MVTLKEIKKTNSDISAVYYPEQGGKGFMRIRIADGVVVEHDRAGFCAPAHVKRELRRLAERDVLPEEKTILWY